MHRHWLIAPGDEKRLKRRPLGQKGPGAGGRWKREEYKSGEINEEHKFYDGRCWWGEALRSGRVCELEHDPFADDFPIKNCGNYRNVVVTSSTIYVKYPKGLAASYFKDMFGVAHFQTNPSCPCGVFVQPGECSQCKLVCTVYNSRWCPQFVG